MPPRTLGSPQEGEKHPLTADTHSEAASSQATKPSDPLRGASKGEPNRATDPNLTQVVAATDGTESHLKRLCPEHKTQVITDGLAAYADACRVTSANLHEQQLEMIKGNALAEKLGKAAEPIEDFVALKAADNFMRLEAKRDDTIAHFVPKLLQGDGASNSRRVPA